MSEPTDGSAGLPEGLRVLAAGEPLARARAAMLLVHGRGATAEDILLFARELAQPGFAYLAPQAPGYTWYPFSFLEPAEANEPYLSRSLGVLDALLARITTAGIPFERTVLLGFSQGACLGLEYAARHARRYGAIIGWSGGLIGSDDAPRDYPGDLAGTPVFLGCSDVDPHVPKPRVDLTAEVLRRLGGNVTERIYPRMAHTVNEDEVDFARGMLAALAPE